MPFSRSQNSKTARKSAFIARCLVPDSFPIGGTKKSADCYSSDFTCQLAPAPIFTVMHQDSYRLVFPSSLNSDRLAAPCCKSLGGETRSGRACAEEAVARG